MAKANNEIILVLRKTAKELSKASTYQWGHMGSCNCGFLAQQITEMSSKEIHSKAMQKHGDWNEQLNDYCPTSGLLMDDLISQMLDFGFDSDDLKHLEKLSDNRILQCLPIEERYLQHNNKNDVIKYLETWATMLEQSLIENIKLPAIDVQNIRKKHATFAEV
ncbi:hypothetical protein [Fulvivirga lutimaris]|uniref:hypothetical protein n=1 Tax=Fulvivirga lutimaris TaxID=1819566 RepID=UPI0012BD652A|nr:hypothetical protein [Fulvivirga lutimaris]MTI38077.1 hypothetical protein [Fulvivirga lutimaris]